MIKTIEMDFEYVNYIPKAPVKTDQLYRNACSNDKVTVNSWAPIWKKNTKENHEKYGPFCEKSIGKLWGKLKNSPAICQGSGPSLRNNIDELKKASEKNIPIISCLHNYHFNEDNEVYPDYYVSLDAGEITIEEISKCGKKSHEEYLESTKGKTLLAYAGSSPRLLESWRGEILFFSCPVPDEKLMGELMEIESFHTMVSSGGNVLGACVYIAKAILGANPICFVGADFCFDYTKRFHPWDDDRYKKVGHAMRGVDCFGNKVLTWQSYFNFKNFFDFVAQKVPGLYVNCTEGGMLGAYPEGNIQDIIQMPLAKFVRMYSMHEDMKQQCLEPSKPDMKILY